jgi:hypothetical protein
MVEKKRDYRCDVNDLIHFPHAFRDIGLDGILSSEDAVAAAIGKNHDPESSQLVLPNLGAVSKN